MPSYKDHDARKRALATPVASNLPKGVSSWCHRIPEEEKASYPIDQSDGGEDAYNENENFFHVIDAARGLHPSSKDLWGM